VQNQGDAWTVTSAYLDRFVEEQRLLTAEAAGHSDEQAAYLRRMDQIGRRVAELQLALASRDDIAAFAPEPIAADDVGNWTEGILQRAGRALGDLARRRSELAENDRQLLDALLSYQDSLPARLGELLPETVDAMKIRHHGDFHLGQMLIVKDDISIIDFEGEPRRSIEDRRRKAPAARDVAGLIRSIDYSATAALERALKSAPDEHHAKLARALEDWREHSVAAFMAAYRSSLRDTRLWPQSPEAADALLDFFLLEKAFYEIEYELAHRPDWLRVPLAGTWRILSRSEGAPQ
jgi:maltose alpha-D-glucosyltransferase/alpha-amylase